MQLTSFTDYGLRTLMYLAAHPDKKSSVKEISEYYGVSRNHLVKVVHRLSQLSYIETTKGKGGGITIAKDTIKLRLGDVVLRLEPNMHMVECFDHKNNSCRVTESCQLKHYLREAAESFVTILNKYTLGDLVSDKKIVQILQVGTE